MKSGSKPSSPPDDWAAMMSNHCERAEKTRAEGMAKMRVWVWVWGGVWGGIGKSFSVSKVSREEEEGKRVVELEVRRFVEGKEEDVTSNTTMQLSYKSIGEYLELPSIHAALESDVSPITARMLTLTILDVAEDMGRDMVFLELIGRKEIEEEREDAEEEREEVEKETDGVRNESLELVLDVRAGGSGYTPLMFSDASRRAI